MTFFLSNNKTSQNIMFHLLLFQLFIALSELKKLKIIHADIKADNIMVADGKGLRIKLIDFGMAMFNHEAKKGTILQAASLRLFHNRNNVVLRLSLLF